MDTIPSIQSSLNAISMRQLQYFVAVAEEEHFTHASERLLIAQPSLSRQIRDLEEALGVELFVRDNRGVRLTGAGRELLVRARGVFEMLEHTVDAVRSAGAGERGHLRLGYGPSFFNNAVTVSALESFRVEAPDVEVILHELFNEQMVPALREGRIDVGFARGIARASDIQSRVICVEPLVVMLPATDDLASQRDVALADLNGRNLIRFPSELVLPFNERVAEVAREANITLNSVREVTQLASIVYHVCRGDGVAIMPQSSALLPTAGAVVREIRDVRATVDLIVLTRRGEQSPIVHRFLELLQPLQPVQECDT